MIVLAQCGDGIVHEGVEDCDDANMDDLDFAQDLLEAVECFHARQIGIRRHEILGLTIGNVSLVFVFYPSDDFDTGSVLGNIVFESKAAELMSLHPPVVRPP